MRATNAKKLPCREPGVEAVFGFVLARATEMGASYADARFQDRRLTLVGLVARRDVAGASPRRETWEVSSHVERGIGLRLLGPDGGEGFAATSDFSRAGLSKLVSDALLGALRAGAEETDGTRAPGGARPRRSDDAARSVLGPPICHVARVATPRRLDPADYDVAAKRDILSCFSAEAFARPGVTSVELAYADSTGIDSFASTEGARVETDSARVILHAKVGASRGAAREGEAGEGEAGEGEAGGGAGAGGARVRDQTARWAASGPDQFDSGESLGGVGGLELLGEPAVKDLASRLSANAVEWLGAETPPGGGMVTILDNQAAENFIHEAVGHSCEGDAVLAGASVMAGKLGVEVGAPNVTVVDDPGRPGTVGMFPFDDEGVQAARVTLIEDGVLRAYLHSRRTAAALGHEPNGHARARDFGHPPIVRMGTISLEPGDCDFDELLEGVDKGIYLQGKRGGQVDPVRGVFQFRPDRARLIEKGDLGRPVRAPSLSGSILDILGNIDAVGRDLKFHPGGCGKGIPSQVIPAGSGAPHVRLRRATIGGGRRS